MMDRRLVVASGSLDEAAAAAASAPVAFGALRGALSASYCLLFAERVDDRQVETPVVEGVDRAYGERLQLAAAESLLPTWLRHLDEGAVIDRAALQRDREFARSDFYNYVIRPEGRFHCLITTPYVTPTRRYHLIVGRPERTDDFNTTETTLLRTLLPHVARLIAATNDAVEATRRSEGLLAAFDRLADNVLVVHGAAELAFANAGARRLLALRDGLVLSGLRLRAMHVEATAALLAAITSVTAADGEDDITLLLPRPSGRPAFQVRVRRVDATPGGRCGDAFDRSARRALLLIRQPEAQSCLNGRSLARLYGLTGREADLVLLLSQGCNLRGAAERLGMSYQTARFHLRGAFSKTDVHSQSDLIRMVLQTCC